MRPYLLVIALITALGAVSVPCAAQTAKKETGMFYPEQIVKTARENARTSKWAAETQKKFVDEAKPWLKYSDDELWSMMFGNTITRSWMVWSNGYCPACKKDVPMYTWVIKALDRPWKVQCPHCKEIFPKNDFGKYYQSGLDEHGIFDPKQADKSLLFNTEHPDPKDPLYKFGVDDGEGYAKGDKRWRFIGAYLIYGQWKQVVLGGIRKLAAAYVVTGDKEYAHKAGVLLDRTADIYPSFDYAKEGLVYEVSGIAGYVSTWHDACEETRELALAYDMVRGTIAKDNELAKFLADKAERFKIDKPKGIPSDVIASIDKGILQDPLEHPDKIHSNYPRTEIALATIRTVLGWPGNRKEVYAIIDPMIEQAIAVDGVTGEKGLAAYSAGVIQTLAMFLAQYERLEPGFLAETFKRHPGLKNTWRFHVDTWCMGEYYPNIGDSGWFAQKHESYAGVPFMKEHGAGGYEFNFSLSPSMFTFFRKLYDLTGDPAYIQVLYNANGKSLDGLPYDMFASDAEGFRKTVKEVINREGASVKLGSIDKKQWHLAILRSGEKDNQRALWLDYDSGGGHGHADGMNVGLYAYGLDLIPDFGYPPVNFGGWGAPRAQWYTVTPAHNTVVVDGRNTVPASGKTTLWADDKGFKAVRASGADLIGGKQYERTAVVIDISPDSFYVLDLFRVVGGNRHDKFMHSHFGTIITKGLSSKPAEDYGGVTQMRNFQCDPSPKAGWSVDWKIDDRHHYMKPGQDVHVRYTDLTNDGQAYTCEGWVLTNGFNSGDEAWIPRIMVRRESKNSTLSSTFLSVIEPYDANSKISEIRRLSLRTQDDKAYPETNAAVEVKLIDGRKDLIMAADVENPLGRTPSLNANKVIVQKDWNVSTDAELCHVRLDASGRVNQVHIYNGTFVRVDGKDYRAPFE